MTATLESPAATPQAGPTRRSFPQMVGRRGWRRNAGCQQYQSRHAHHRRSRHQQSGNARR